VKLSSHVNVKSQEGRRQFLPLYMAQAALLADLMVRDSTTFSMLLLSGCLLHCCAITSLSRLWAYSMFIVFAVTVCYTNDDLVSLFDCWIYYLSNNLIIRVDGISRGCCNKNNTYHLTKNELKRNCTILSSHTHNHSYEYTLLIFDPKVSVKFNKREFHY